MAFKNRSGSILIFEKCNYLYITITKTSPSLEFTMILTGCDEKNTAYTHSARLCCEQGLLSVIFYG
jgi:hypothetical protein